MDFPDPMLHRWTIDTAAGTVTEEQIDDRPAEFPRVADAVIGKKHRFGYETAMSREAYEDPMAGGGGLLKYDRDTGERTSIELGAGRLPGEAVFAPAADGSAEDDGYLMTYVYDAASNRSDYVIFDAKSMSSDPVASVHLPRVPFGFHGSWIPADVAD